MTQRASSSSQRVGRLLVHGMPKLLRVLSIVGTAAMLWVGGHIILAGSDELGWHDPYDAVHDLEHEVHDVEAIGGVLGWMVNTAVSAAVGFVVGAILVFIVASLPFGKRKQAEAHAH
jgi:predicted DNA repair protein MutK